MEPEDFQALYSARFSEAAEAATLSLVERAYGFSEPAPVYVAGSREELSREGPQGITVRDLRHNGEQTLPGTAPTVMDVREAYTELDRFASIPGNLLPDSPGVQRRAVLRLAKRLVRPNLTINLAETDARRRQAAAAVKDAVISIKKGQRVIGDGELVNETHLVASSGMRSQTDRLDLVQLQVGGTGLVALLISATYALLPRGLPALPAHAQGRAAAGPAAGGDAGPDAALGVHRGRGAGPLHGAAARGASTTPSRWRPGAMLVRFILSEELALFFALVLACLCGVMLGNSLSFGIYALVGSLVAADRITRAKDRVGIFKAGLSTGAVEPGGRALPLPGRGQGAHRRHARSRRCSPSWAPRWRCR